MSQIIQAKRRFNVWGKDIEPEYAVRPDYTAPSKSPGVGIRIEGLEKSFGDVRVLILS